MAQPGFHQAMDFTSHLQQQLNGRQDGNQMSQQPQQPQPQQNTPQHQHQHQSNVSVPDPERAAQELQHHIEWYKATYGASPNLHAGMNYPTGLPATSSINVPRLDNSQPPMDEMSVNSGMNMQQLQAMGFARPQTPTAYSGHPQSHTVPNTPQNCKVWSSPPPPHAKHARSQSYQFDVAPMPSGYGMEPTIQVTEASYNHSQGNFGQNGFVENGQGYASSAYSSSVANSSPPPQMSTPHMPTLYEEDPEATMGQQDILLQATAGADGDEEFFLNGPPRPMSPRQAALDALDIDASIVRTEVTSEQIQHYMSEQDPKDNKWKCMYPECNASSFGRKENIRAHIQTHLGDRPYLCNPCGKRFVRQHDLKRHAKIHSGDKSAECVCGMKFARKDALTRHRQRGMCEGALPGFEKARSERKPRGRPRKIRDDRPTIDERTEKAQRARQLDSSQRGQQQHYASSSSGHSSLPPTPEDTSGHYDASAFIDMLDQSSFDPTVQQWRDTPPTSPVSGTSPAANTAQHKTPADSKSQDPSTFDFNSAPLNANNCVSPSALSVHSSPPLPHAKLATTTANENQTTANIFEGGSSPPDEAYDIFAPDAADFNFGAIDTNPGLGGDAFSPPGASDSSGSSVFTSDFDVPSSCHGSFNFGEKNGFAGSVGARITSHHEQQHDLWRIDEDYDYEMPALNMGEQADLDAWLGGSPGS